MYIYYLHGFASSPRSQKADYFAARLRAHDLALRCPDFNQPDFESLTMTRMCDQLAADIATLDAPLADRTDATAGHVAPEPRSNGLRAKKNAQPIVLIGSSLGAVVALHTAARLRDRVDRLVLLAPAVSFPDDASKVLGAGRVAQWQATGTLDVFHHVSGGLRPLSYRFYEDGVRHGAFAAEVGQPTLIFQGVRDESVDHRAVEQFAAARPNMQLTLLDDDHQLLSSLPRIWTDTAAFLELT